MSTFIGITCYDEHGREGGNVRRLRRGDLEEAVKTLSNFRLVGDERSCGVQLPGTDLAAMLERNGTLSCQLDPRTDVEHLLDTLRTLAAALPNAVIEDEEGEEY